MSIAIEDIKYLNGCWKGEGVAEFPTIKAYDYSENLFFSFNDKNRVVHFEQLTWIKSNDERNNEPISWESGFIIDKGNDLFELIAVHNSGRLEWYRGFAELLESGKIKIEFKNVAVINDDRLISSIRIFHFAQSCICYEQSMQTTKVRQSKTHLKAELFR
jgi:hypothetical protein